MPELLFFLWIAAGSPIAGDMKSEIADGGRDTTRPS